VHRYVLTHDYSRKVLQLKITKFGNCTQDETDTHWYICIITLRAKLSGTVYGIVIGPICGFLAVFVCGFVCGFVGLLPR